MPEVSFHNGSAVLRNAALSGPSETRCDGGWMFGIPRNCLPPAFAGFVLLLPRLLGLLQARLAWAFVHAFRQKCAVTFETRMAEHALGRHWGHTACSHAQCEVSAETGMNRGQNCLFEHREREFGESPQRRAWIEGRTASRLLTTRGQFAAVARRVLGLVAPPLACSGLPLWDSG